MSKNEKKQDETTQEEPQAESVMYVGPPISNPIPLETGTVFSSGLPSLLKKAVSTNVSLAALFVPLKKAGEAMKQLKVGEGELIKHVKVITEASKRRI